MENLAENYKTAIKARVAPGSKLVACVASVSVGFGRKERDFLVFCPRGKWGESQK